MSLPRERNDGEAVHAAAELMLAEARRPLRLQRDVRLFRPARLPLPGTRFAKSRELAHGALADFSVHSHVIGWAVHGPSRGVAT